MKNTIIIYDEGIKFKENPKKMYKDLKKFNKLIKDSLEKTNNKLLLIGLNS